MDNNEKTRQKERQSIQQLAPDAQAAVATQGYNLGFTVDHMISTRVPESREQMLETLSSRRNLEMFSFLINYFTTGFVQAAAVDNIGAEMFEKVRVQTVAINTIFGRLSEHGQAYQVGKHKEVFPFCYPAAPTTNESERPVDNAPKVDKKPNSPSTETL